MATATQNDTGVTGGSMMPQESIQHKYDMAKEDAVITGIGALISFGVARFALTHNNAAVKSTAGVFVLISAGAGLLCIIKTVKAIKYSSQK